MTLSSKVESKINPALLISLTRHGEKGTFSTPNATVLAEAVEDAKNDFETHTGVVFDDTDSSHITVGYWGVMFHLHDYAGKDTEKSEQRFIKRCIAWSHSRGAERRILPTTSSVRRRTERVTDELLEQDNRHWDDFVPGSPGPELYHDDC